MPCVRLFKFLHIIYRLYLHDFSDYSLISPFLIIRKIIRKGVNRIGENCKSAQFNLLEHRSGWSTELTTVNSVQCLCITESVAFFPKYTCTLSIQRLFIIPLKCFTTYMYFLQNILNLSSSARERNIWMLSIIYGHDSDLGTYAHTGAWNSILIYS